MALSPTSSRGATFNGGTITGALEVATTDVDTIAVDIDVPNAMNENALEVSTATGPAFGVYADNTSVAAQAGGGSNGSATLQASTTTGDLSLSNAAGTRSVALGTDATSDLASFLVSGSSKLGVSKNGYLSIKTVAAPADAEVAINTLSFWFDNTDGLNKLMIKAKQQNGTVSTAAIPLT